LYDNIFNIILFQSLITNLRKDTLSISYLDLKIDEIGTKKKKEKRKKKRKQRKHEKYKEEMKKLIIKETNLYIEKRKFIFAKSGEII